jgi:hypothetical protein
MANRIAVSTESGSDRVSRGITDDLVELSGSESNTAAVSEATQISEPSEIAKAVPKNEKSAGNAKTTDNVKEDWGPAEAGLPVSVVCSELMTHG